jgi:iron complex outermembrane receptor protein
MQINVTIAARRPEPVATTPAAISVITGDDIRRAGVTTVGDAIALADGVHVARFNNGTWAISARGFDAVAANKPRRWMRRHGRPRLVATLGRSAHVDPS